MRYCPAGQAVQLFEPAPRYCPAEHTRLVVVVWVTVVVVVNVVVDTVVDVTVVRVVVVTVVTVVVVTVVLVTVVAEVVVAVVLVTVVAEVVVAVVAVVVETVVPVVVDTVVVVAVVDVVAVLVVVLVTVVTVVVDTVVDVIVVAVVRTVVVASAVVVVRTGKSMQVSPFTSVSAGQSSTHMPSSSVSENVGRVRSRTTFNALHVLQSNAVVPVQPAPSLALHDGWHGKQLASLSVPLIMQSPNGSWCTLLAYIHVLAVEHFPALLSFHQIVLSEANA